MPPKVTIAPVIISKPTVIQTQAGKGGAGGNGGGAHASSGGAQSGGNTTGAQGGNTGAVAASDGKHSLSADKKP